MFPFLLEKKIPYAIRKGRRGEGAPHDWYYFLLSVFWGLCVRMTWERRSSFRFASTPLFSFYSYVLSRVICMGYDGSVAFWHIFGLGYSSIVFRHLWNTPPYNPLFLCLIGLVFVGWIRHFAQVKMISPIFSSSCYLDFLGF